MKKFAALLVTTLWFSTTASAEFLKFPVEMSYELASRSQKWERFATLTSEEVQIHLDRRGYGLWTKTYDLEGVPVTVNVVAFKKASDGKIVQYNFYVRILDGDHQEASFQTAVASPELLNPITLGSKQIQVPGSYNDLWVSPVVTVGIPKVVGRISSHAPVEELRVAE